MPFGAFSLRGASKGRKGMNNSPVVVLWRLTESASINVFREYCYFCLRARQV